MRQASTAGKGFARQCGSSPPFVSRRLVSHKPFGRSGTRLGVSALRWVKGLCGSRENRTAATWVYARSRRKSLRRMEEGCGSHGGGVGSHGGKTRSAWGSNGSQSAPTYMVMGEGLAAHGANWLCAMAPEAASPRPSSAASSRVVKRRLPPQGSSSIAPRGRQVLSSPGAVKCCGVAPSLPFAYYDFRFRVFRRFGAAVLAPRRLLPRIQVKKSRSIVKKYEL